MSIIQTSIKEKITSKSETSSSNFCDLPDVPERTLNPNMDPHRIQLILILDKKWVNGTILHYYFFDKDSDGRERRLSNGSSEWITWTTNEREKEIVRNAFDTWKNQSIGIDFKEVDTREEAEIRIGFMRGDGSWSYLGRDIIDIGIGRDERTMNFGWDLTRNTNGLDTAIHEIGHTLGFPHEHQNPNSGIIWDEEAVYRALSNPPNNWNREKTYHNIIRKIDPDSIQGSSWDPESVMHYPFHPGLILEPSEYNINGITPSGGLSERDKIWVRTFYPPLEESYPELKAFESAKLVLFPGEQQNFAIKPNASRRYNIRTFGNSDTVMVLFEEANGELLFLEGSDDSGMDENAKIRCRLRKDRKYVLRIRMYFEDSAGETAVMMW
ncbi:M12 family metallopeptidase [Lunatibacter salilacus]|uniref:M12 family metallopeptidase n=1 Tax=Lunatibacter salilacus TaxID=2483804 RepID=UPI00131E6338|nr:M12 family metallopeptidase [Lunatibacter salilacus]